MLAVDELSCLLRDETRVIGDGGLVLHFPILERATLFYISLHGRLAGSRGELGGDGSS